EFALASAEVDPGFRQVFKQATVLLSGYQRAQEAIASVVFCRDIVDFSRAEADRLLCVPDRQVLLAAIAAEMRGVKQHILLLPPRCDTLGIERDMAPASLFQRGEHLARSTDELVQLERERRPALGSAYIMGSHQKTLQGGT